MGNLFCKFLRLFRHRTFPGGRRTLPGSRRRVVFPVCGDGGPPGRNHPAAPAQALRPGPRHPERVRLPAASHTQRTRRACIPRALYSFLGSLPLVTWKDPPKKPRLCTSDSRMFGPSRTIFIPPPMRKFTLPCSPPRADSQVYDTSTIKYHPIPLPCSKEMEVKIQEEPKKARAENEEDHVATNGQDHQNSQQSSGDLPLTTRPPKTPGAVISVERGPGPLGGGPQHPQSRWSENAQEPPPKPDPEAAAPSAPTASCSPLPERPTKEALGEDHLRSSPDSLTSGKERQSPKPSDMPSRSSSSLVSASSMLCKRKKPMPLSLPLPPLLWDRGELPVPCKLPCLAFDTNRDTLKIPSCQWNKIVEDKTKVMADFSATQSGPFTPPGVVADTLPVATHNGQVPVTSANAADLSARLPTLCGPTPLTQNTDHFPLPVHSQSLLPLSSNHILGIPPNKNGGRLHSVRTTTSPISDLSTPAMTSFQLPFCNNESLTPMCVDSPRPALSLPTPLPVPSANLPPFIALPTNSVAVPSTSANASPSLTGQCPSDFDVTDMDTTGPPPFEVFVFTAAPRPRMRSRKPQVYCRVENPPKLVVSSTGPSASKYLRLIPNYAGGPQTTPQPT